MHALNKEDTSTLWTCVRVSVCEYDQAIVPSVRLAVSPVFACTHNVYAVHSPDGSTSPSTAAARRVPVADAGRKHPAATIPWNSGMPADTNQADRPGGTHTHTRTHRSLVSLRTDLMISPPGLSLQPARGFVQLRSPVVMATAASHGRLYERAKLQRGIKTNGDHARTTLVYALLIA